MLKKVVSLFIIMFTLKIYQHQCPVDDQYCLSCQDNLCKFCVDSFVNSNGQCIPTNIKVQNCLSYNPDETCKYCNFGYFLDQQKCNKIETKDCLQQDNQGNCLMCDKQILVQNNQCNLQNTCQTENCQYCSLNNNQEVCVQCIDGYFAFNTGTRYECIQEQTTGVRNCILVDQNNQTKCLLCRFGYYNSNGNCFESNSYTVQI